MANQTCTGKHSANRTCHPKILDGCPFDVPERSHIIASSADVDIQPFTVSIIVTGKASCRITYHFCKGTVIDTNVFCLSEITATIVIAAIDEMSQLGEVCLGADEIGVKLRSTTLNGVVLKGCGENHIAVRHCQSGWVC